MGYAGQIIIRLPAYHIILHICYVIHPLHTSLILPINSLILIFLSSLTNYDNEILHKGILSNGTTLINNTMQRSLLSLAPPQQPSETTHTRRV